MAYKNGLQMGGDPITRYPSPGMILQTGAPGFLVTTRLVVEATLLKDMIDKKWDHETPRIGMNIQ